MRRERACSLAQLPEGLPYPITIDEEEIMLVRLGDTVFALVDRCSHQDFPLSLGKVSGNSIKCAAHGAEFDLRSGAALCAPAFAPVSAYTTIVENGEVFIEID